MKLVVAGNTLWSLCIAALQHQHHGPLRRQKPRGRPWSDFVDIFLITHSNEEKKMCLGMRPDGLLNTHLFCSPCPEQFILMDFMLIFMLFPFPPSSFLHKICTSHDTGCNFGVYSVVLRIVCLACPLPVMLCLLVGIPSGCVSDTSGQPHASGDTPASEAIGRARSSCMQLWHALIWTLPAFLTPLHGVCCWVMLSFCPPTWPKFCRTSPPAMVLNAKLAEMTHLTSTLICWLEICVRNTIHL